MLIILRSNILSFKTYSTSNLIKFNFCTLSVLIPIISTICTIHYIRASSPFKRNCRPCLLRCKSQIIRFHIFCLIRTYLTHKSIYRHECYCCHYCKDQCHHLFCESTFLHILVPPSYLCFVIYFHITYTCIDSTNYTTFCALLCPNGAKCSFQGANCRTACKSGKKSKKCAKTAGHISYICLTVFYRLLFSFIIVIR